MILVSIWSAKGRGKGAQGSESWIRWDIKGIYDRYDALRERSFGGHGSHTAIPVIAAQIIPVTRMADTVDKTSTCKRTRDVSQSRKLQCPISLSHGRLDVTGEVAV
jgi:hypothetical protein